MNTKFNLLLVFFISISIGVFAQIKPFSKPFVKSTQKGYQNFSKRNDKISPYTSNLINDINRSKLKSTNSILAKEIKDRYLIREYHNTEYVGALLKVKQCIKQSDLYDLNIIIGAQINDIWSVKIPVNELENLTNIACVDYIQIDEPIKTKLDNARITTWVDLVHQGYALPQSYFGKDVVVGIIDNGFDYTHPMFYDTTGTDLRIARVWNTIVTGTPPDGYDYGSELIGENEILNAQYSVEEGSHGTHVAGIATGSGVGTESKYTGVAPNSEVVLVQYGGGQSAIIDGINYIFNYANSVNKPAVINMSLGTHIGPHDGTSMFDQDCDNLVGQGKILVGAAGNEGNTPLHASHIFSNDTVETLVYFEDSQSNTGWGIIDIWGNANTDFTIAVNIIDKDGYYQAWTPYLKSSTEPYLDTTFIFNNDTVWVAIGGESGHPTNNRPRFLVDIDNQLSDFYVTIELTSKDNTIHIWNHGHCNGAPLTNEFPGFGIIPGWIDGNTNYTVGEIGGTGNSIITVGAYTSKNNYTDYSGNNHDIGYYTAIGEIAPFSSIGPTVDGRTKPDIIAPGNVIVSSVNSFDSEYPSSSPEVVLGVTDGTNNWYFAKMQGTSMAAPMVAGIIALWLEANPNLTPLQIKQFMQNNAWTDSYTGSVPNNTWGWGKIDAHEGIKQILDNLPPKPGITITGETTFCQGDSVVLSAPAGYLYSWSNGEDEQNINVTQPDSYSLKVIDSNGWESPSSDTIKVYVDSLPDKPDIIASGVTTFCQGDSLTLSAPSGFTYNWSNGVSTREMKIDTTGSYSLTVTDENSCTSPVSDTVIVTVNALPVIDLGNDTTITTDYIIFLDAGAGFASYLWSNDSITQTIEIDGSEVGTGIYNYSVTVTDDNTCSNSDTIEITVESGSGIDNLSLKPLIKLYPNPTTGIINIIIEGYSEQNLTIEVLNITGELVYSKQLKNMKVKTIEKIDLSDQPKGIYIIKLHNNKIMHFRKVLLQ